MGRKRVEVCSVDRAACARPTRWTVWVRRGGCRLVYPCLLPVTSVHLHAPCESPYPELNATPSLEEHLTPDMWVCKYAPPRFLNNANMTQVQPSRAPTQPDLLRLRIRVLLHLFYSALVHPQANRGRTSTRMSNGVPSSRPSLALRGCSPEAR